MTTLPYFKFSFKKKRRYWWTWSCARYALCRKVPKYIFLRVDTGDDGRISKEEFTNPKVKDAIEKVTNLNYFGK